MCDEAEESDMHMLTTNLLIKAAVLSFPFPLSLCSSFIRVYVQLMFQSSYNIIMPQQTYSLQILPALSSILYLNKRLLSPLHSKLLPSLL